MTVRYERPETIDAAVGLLAGSPTRTRILAGGTDLLVQLRSGMIEPCSTSCLMRLTGKSMLPC